MVFDIGMNVGGRKQRSVSDDWDQVCVIRGGTDLLLIGVTRILQEYRIENRRYGYNAHLIEFYGPHQSIPLEKLGGVSFWNHPKRLYIAIFRIMFHEDFEVTPISNTYYFL